MLDEPLSGGGGDVEHGGQTQCVPQVSVGQKVQGKGRRVGAGSRVMM